MSLCLKFVPQTLQQEKKKNLQSIFICIDRDGIALKQSQLESRNVVVALRIIKHHTEEMM